MGPQGSRLLKLSADNQQTQNSLGLGLGLGSLRVGTVQYVLPCSGPEELFCPAAGLRATGPSLGLVGLKHVLLPEKENASVSKSRAPGSLTPDS